MLATIVSLCATHTHTRGGMPTELQTFIANYFAFLFPKECLFFMLENYLKPRKGKIL